MKNEPMHSDCPSNETLAALVDGQLSPRERQQVMQHMTSCDNDCYGLYRDIADANRAVEEGAAENGDGVATATRPHWNFILSAAASLAIAALLVAAIFIPQFRDRLPFIPKRWIPTLTSISASIGGGIRGVGGFIAQIPARLPFMPKHGIAALVDVSGQYRNIDGRLSGFPYRPLQPVMRGTSDDDTTNPKNWKIAAIADQIQTDAAASPTVDNLHALGVSHLLLGNWSAAVETLEAALRKETGAHETLVAIRASRRAALLNDLCAAYYATAQNKHRPQLLPQALECAKRALMLDPKSPEVAWNYAVCLDALGLREQASKAWEEYLRLDPTGAALDEVRRRRAALQMPTQKEQWAKVKLRLEAEVALTSSTATLAVASCPSEASEWVKDQISDWAAATDRGQVLHASALLRRAGIVATAIRDRSQDHLLFDAVNVCANAQDDHQRTVITTLLDANRRFESARQRYRARDIDAAARDFTAAEDTFSRVHCPLSFCARIGRASCEFYRARYGNALAALRSSSSRNGSYNETTAQALWLTGLCQQALGEPFDAVGSFQQARDLFDAMNAIESASAMRVYLAQTLESTGQSERAWRERLAALDALKRLGPSLRLHQCLFEATNASLNNQHYAAALAFATEILRYREFCEDPELATYALLARGLVEESLSLDATAIHTFDEARRVALRLKASEVGRVALNIDLATSSTLPPQEAMRALDADLSKAISSDARFFVASLYLQRAKVRLRMGERLGAETDLSLTIRELESQRDTAPNGISTLFADADEAFDLLMQLLDVDGRKDELLATSERRKRFRDHVDAPAALDEAAVRHLVDEIRLRHDRTAIVAYAALPTQTLAFVIDSTGIEEYHLPRGAAELKEDVQRFAGAAASGLDVKELRLSGRGLSGELIGAIGPRIARANTIIFVPDKFLDAVPFAALSAGDDGRFLIQSHRIVTAPTAAMGTAYTERATHLGSRALVVAVSSGQIFGSQTLRAVAKEARAVASLYAHSIVLSGAAATRGAFLEALRSVDVLQFSGHAAGDSAGVRALLMASATNIDESDHIYPSDLTPPGHIRLQVAFLSACSTAAARRRPGDTATLPLARALALGGARTVVGTLWDVEDEAAARFAIDFHRALKHCGAAEALREVQLTRIKGGVDRSSWAAFEAMAGA